MRYLKFWKQEGIHEQILLTIPSGSSASQSQIQIQIPKQQRMIVCTWNLCLPCAAPPPSLAFVITVSWTAASGQSERDSFQDGCIIVYVMVKDHILCKTSIFSLVVYTKSKYNNSPLFVTFKLLLFKYRHNVHVICPKILFPIIERKKAKAILFSYDI